MISPSNDYPLLPPIRTAKGKLTDCTLLLEGGSFRGIYSAGVCDVLMENGIHPKAVAGVSAGALCGWNMMARQIGRFARICILHRHDSRYSGWKAVTTDGGLVGFRFLLDTLYYRSSIQIKLPVATYVYLKKKPCAYQILQQRGQFFIKDLMGAKIAVSKKSDPICIITEH